MRLIRILSILAVLLTLGVAARPSAAQQPSKEFLDAYQAGVDAYRLGRYEEAKAQLEAAKAIDPTLPGPWRFLAAVAKAEDRFADCVASAREAIRLNPQSSEFAATRDLHDACRAALGKPAFTGTFEPGQGALAITSEPSGATIEVGGLSYGSTPLAPRAVVAGDVEVRLSKPGFLPATQKVTVVPGVVTDVDAVLEVDPNAQIVDTGPPKEITTGWLKVETTAPGAVVRVEGETPAADDQGRFVLEQGTYFVEVSAPGREPVVKKVRVTRGQVTTFGVELRDAGAVNRQRRTGYTILGAGLGLAVAGAVTGVISLRAADEARDWAEIERNRPLPSRLPLDASDAVQPIHTREEIEARVDTANTWGLVSTITYAAAAVTVGVGAYYLVKARPRDEERPAVTFTPVLGPAGGDGVVAGAVTEVRW